jgi:hypothetical protein
MSSTPDPPPPPDYTPVAQGQIESAQLAAQVAREQLQWAKDQYADNKEVTQKVIDKAFATQDAESAAAAADRKRYQDKFQPQEDALIADANKYGSVSYQEQEAGRAAATTNSQIDAARQGAVADLESYGIDPSQTRSAAMDLGIRVAQGAASAGAANAGREQAINRGMATRSEAINVGRGYGSQIAQTYGTALAAGNQAVNAGLATTASGAATMGTAPGWQGIAGQSMLGAADTMTKDYNNQYKSWQSQTANAGGTGAAIGTVAGGIIGAYFGAPTVGAAAGGALGRYTERGYAEGGRINKDVQVEQAQAIPTPQGGGPVPERGPVEGVPAAISPSGGNATDDVRIKVNVGELVLPEDVVAWKGEEFFHKMAIKVREDMGQKMPRGLGGRPHPKQMAAIQQQGA